MGTRSKRKGLAIIYIDIEQIGWFCCLLTLMSLMACMSGLQIWERLAAFQSGALSTDGDITLMHTGGHRKTLSHQSTHVVNDQYGTKTMFDRDMSGVETDMPGWMAKEIDRKKRDTETQVADESLSQNSGTETGTETGPETDPDPMTENSNALETTKETTSSIKMSKLEELLLELGILSLPISAAFLNNGTKNFKVQVCSSLIDSDSQLTKCSNFSTSSRAGRWSHQPDVGMITATGILFLISLVFLLLAIISREFCFCQKNYHCSILLFLHVSFICLLIGNIFLNSSQVANDLSAHVNFLILGWMSVALLGVANMIYLGITPMCRCCCMEGKQLITYDRYRRHRRGMSTCGSREEDCYQTQKSQLIVRPVSQGRVEQMQFSNQQRIID